MTDYVTSLSNQDVRDAAPPPVDDGIHGSKRYEQIGVSAYEKLLESLLSDLEMPGRGGVFVVDLHMSVGQGFDAVLRKSYNFPMFYLGVSDEDTALEWFQAVASYVC